MSHCSKLSIFIFSKFSCSWFLIREVQLEKWLILDFNKFISITYCVYYIRGIVSGVSVFGTYARSGTHAELLVQELTQRGCHLRGLSWELSTHQLISHTRTAASWFSVKGYHLTEPSVPSSDTWVHVALGFSTLLDYKHLDGKDKSHLSE